MVLVAPASAPVQRKEEGDTAPSPLLIGTMATSSLLLGLGICAMLAWWPWTVLGKSEKEKGEANGVRQRLLPRMPPSQMRPSRTV